MPLKIASGASLILMVVTALASPQKHDDSAKGSEKENPVARGKYIVEGLAVGGQCHTSRNSQGELDRDRPLQGAPVWLQPSKPTGDWPLEAPRIAGIPPGSDDQIVKLLTTGIWRDGRPLRPPMPQFRMSPQGRASRNGLPEIPEPGAPVA